jgi:hypothetical protein
MAKLRCRVGDTVMIILKDSNYGKIGVITRRNTLQERVSCNGGVDGDHIWRVQSLGGPYHVTNEVRRWVSPEVCARDCELRPLRDEPGEDEMLRIAGKPKRVRKSKRMPVQQVQEVRHD